MLSPDDYTQPVAPVAGARADNRTQSDIDSKIESKGQGPKMISFTLPAFGLICATLLIGCACAFVIGRMTNTPAQAANVENLEMPPSPVDNLTATAGLLDISPLDTADTPAAETSSDGAAAPVALPSAVWGFEVIHYKLDDSGLTLAETYRARLLDKGFTEVFVLQKSASIAVIVGANPSYKALKKELEAKLTAKGLRADPVKFNPAQVLQ